jgi:nucleoid-associated protein YgaU
MSSDAGGGTGMSARTAAALVGGVGAAVIAAVVFLGPQNDAPAPGDEAVQVQPETEAMAPETATADDAATPVEEDTAEGAPEPQSEPEPEPVFAAPRFDQIRVAPDGSTVIAGQAPAGAEVSLILDGDEIAATRSSGAGDFAAILTLPPSAEPRIMSLLAITPDGTEVPGEETVIIAPFGMVEVDAPEAVAAVELPPETPATAETLAEAPVPEGDATADAAVVAVEEAVEEDVAEVIAPAAPEPEPVAEPVAEAAAPETAAAPEETTIVAEAAPAPVELVEAPEQPAAQPPVDEPAPAPAEPAEAPEVSQPPAQDETPTTEVASAEDESIPSAGTDQTDTAEAAETPTGEAEQAPAIVVASSEGVRVVQGGAPEVQTEVRIDAITYTLEGEVAISGRGRSDRQVQILLNNRPIQLGEIGPEGQWSLELPDVDPGTYTLTVAQLSPEGEIESRVDTPFLREDPARVAASPMRVNEGVSVITVQPGFTLWGIAEANFGDGIAYVQIFQENRENIRDPDLIFPGQIFQLPDLPRAPMEP